MRRLTDLLATLARDSGGTMAIETAFVVPILLVMTFGGFEVSYMVARQSELRTAASEAVAITLSREAGQAVNDATVEDILEASTGLDDADVTLSRKYRCDLEDDLVDLESECAEGTVVSTFIVIEMDDTYTPAWTQFGIGGPVNFTVERTVQIG
jgi:hypothetical protein